MALNKNKVKGNIRGIKKVTSLSNVQKEIDSFSQKLKALIVKQINIQEQNTCLNPKKVSPEHSVLKGLATNTMTKSPIFTIYTKTK